MHRLVRSELTSLLPADLANFSCYPRPFPALFLDRDGVINIDTGYLHRSEDCRFVDGIFDVAREFAPTHALIIVTNQAGIGRGFYTEDQFADFMNWMQERFANEGVPLTAVYYCPDHPEDGICAYRRHNDWRKPGAGMFMQAARDFPIDMARSWCIGDTAKDMIAADRAGVGTRVLLSGERNAKVVEASHHVECLGEVRRLLAAPAESQVRG